MKKALILFVSIATIGCEYNGMSIQKGIGVNLVAYPGDSVTIRDQQAQFSVEVLEISDGRCPIGLLCIWGGEASVKFKIESNVFLMKISESKDFTIDQRNFRITLKDVAPYPVYQNDNTKKQHAVFVVERI